MSASIEINPFADSIDLLGEPDRSSAYSLSGHVVISLSSMASFFERRRTIRLILQSLLITFEGQTELVSEETGYAAVRLCSISEELAPGEPVELSNEGHEESDKPCTWNVVFNLTIPGWLPATTIFGDSDSSEAGTQYALYATAKFESIEDGPSKSWFSTLCTPFRHPTRVLRAPKYPIRLNRYVNPASSASSSASTFPIVNYHVTAEVEPRDESKTDPPQIPLDILRKIRILASVPEHVSTEETSLPLTLRFRPDNLSTTERKRLRLSEFSVDLEQTERYRTSTLPGYSHVYPLPPKKEQPPHKPLLSPHPIQAIFDLGLADVSPPNHVLTRAFSLLPTESAGKFSLAGDGYIFAQEAEGTQEVSWSSLRTTIPFVDGEDNRKYDWKHQRRLRASGQSPLFGVNHHLHVSIMCTYDLSEGENPERAQERLTFKIPVRFVDVLPVSSRTSSPAPGIASGRFSLASDNSTPRCSTSSDFPPPSLPYAQTLPAYSQLFEPNGDRKIDYSFPLPVYTPHATKDDILCDISD